MRIPTFRQFQLEADTINKQFDQMNYWYEHQQNKILHASEDPVLSAQIDSLTEYVKSFDNYTNNGVLAQNHLSLISSSIQNVLSKLTSQVTPLVLQAQNGTLSPENRQNIADQLQGHLAALLNYANVQDGSGNYLFGGFNVTTPPFVSVNGGYQYQGGYTPATINIGPNVDSLFYESGYNVFADIYSGNGTYTITATTSNTGSAVTTPGTVGAGYIPDTYTLTFVTNSSGQLAYQVTGVASGQVIPQQPLTTPADAPAYQSGAAVNFNGVNFNISGTPNVGDSFQIQPSTQENVFNIMQDLVNLLQNPPTNQGQYNQQLTQLSSALDQATSQLQGYISQVGTQQQVVDSQIHNNESTKLIYTTAESALADADPFVVYTALAQHSVALQATRDAYLKLQDTLLQLLKL